jgi:hypothetical protein
MRNEHVIRMATAVVLALGLAAGSGAAMSASQKDTVEDVVKAGRDGGLGLNKLQSELTTKARGEKDPKAKDRIDAQLEALRKVRPFLARLERDRAFAKQVLELAAKNDRAGLGTLVGREIQAQTQIRDIRDFFLMGHFKLMKYEVAFCISSDSICGTNSTSSFSLEIT